MFITWIKRLFDRASSKERRAIPERKPWPTREEIALLPVFEGLRLHDIEVVGSTEAAEHARVALENAGTVGFDTESKPTFLKGQESTGPHVAQFATLEKAYVFLLRHDASRKIAAALIASPRLKKVGFGLNDDLKRIVIKLGVTPKSVVDIESLFRARGYGRGVGVKVAVALVFNQQFRKSKKASTSNWNRFPLMDKQVLYAANDAYAAIRVLEALPKLK